MAASKSVLNSAAQHQHVAYAHAHACKPERIVVDDSTGNRSPTFLHIALSGHRDIQNDFGSGLFQLLCLYLLANCLLQAFALECVWDTGSALRLTHGNHTVWYQRRGLRRITVRLRQHERGMGYDGRKTAHTRIVEDMTTSVNVSE